MQNDHLQADVGFGIATATPNVGRLKGRFLMPPFSTWNTRDGDWQNRKRLWLAKGIESELGRDNVTYNVRHMEAYRAKEGMRDNPGKLTGTSIFDPVLCELAYTWWCPPGGVVLDPFAGGSVRGIVASVLDFKYLGLELRGEQVAANRAQLGPATTGKYPPKWRQADSFREVHKAPKCDFLFSCPPYGNLEVYSDDPDDISNMPYDQFLGRYSTVIENAVERLHDNRFACFVVANYRSKEKGRQMLDFVGDTVRAFEDAGAHYYNEIILLNAIGTAAARANTNFVRGARKVVKVHQNILVFCKGDPKAAAAGIPADAGPGE